MLLLLPYSEFLRRLAEPRNIADVVLVFFLVYGVSKLVRGTRATPMAAGIAALAILYWLSHQRRTRDPGIRSYVVVSFTSAWRSSFCFKLRFARH